MRKLQRLSVLTALLLIALGMANRPLSAAMVFFPEGVSAGTTVYSSTAVGGGMTYALVGADASAFFITSWGAVMFTSTPDFETKSVYNFNINASQSGAPFSTEQVTVYINNLAPVITSGNTVSITEGANAGTMVYTAVAFDPAGGTVTYSLTGADAFFFAINSVSGVVTINSMPNYETKSSYNFNVRASDPSGAFSSQAISVYVNNQPPVIGSGSVASIDEGASWGTTVYTAFASDPAGGTITYSLFGPDASAFTINSSSGTVTMIAIPNYETKSSYNITITASDSGGLVSAKDVTVNVNNLWPVISSAAAASINEGISAGSTVYTAVAADPGGGSITYSLVGGDAWAFTINSFSGAVTINSTPNFETQSSYNFSVNASDLGFVVGKQVTLNINNLPPAISSVPTASINEGINAGTTVYTATAADPGGGPVYYVLNGPDAAAFTIDSSSGAVTINGVPNFETKSSYYVTIRAVDPFSLFAIRDVTINVNNLPPVISSGSTASIIEGASAGTTVYTAVAADPGGGSATYSLIGPDASAFTINSSTGVVTINSVPNYSIKSSYNFSVVATDALGSFSTQAVMLTVTIPVVPFVLTGSSWSSNGVFGFSFTNVAGASFTVLASTNASLPASSWTVIGLVTENSPGQYHFSHPQATDSRQRFYRVRSP